VGTPPQLVEVQIDTGSSELWLNPTCTNAWYPYGCTQNGFYVSASSSTKQLSSQTFSITYGLGSVTGLYIEDNIVMGGKLFHPMLDESFADLCHRSKHSCAAVRCSYDKYRYDGRNHGGGLGLWPRYKLLQHH
jgi:Eukaryotic aspartyl protease